MRTLMTLFLTLALAGPVTAICDPDAILGAWDWVRTEGGFIGETLTPASEGYTRQIQFTADGRLLFYQDSILQEVGHYLFACPAGAPELSTPDSQPSAWPLMDFCEPRAVVFIEEGGVPLLLIDDVYCADTYDYYFSYRGPVAPEPTTWEQVKALYR